jgi:hypothetical protein
VSTVHCTLSQLCGTEGNVLTALITYIAVPILLYAYVFYCMYVSVPNFITVLLCSHITVCS